MNTCSWKSFCILRRAACGLLLAGLGYAAFAQDQAAATATRRSALQAYGGYTFSQPDWGLQGVNNNGFFLGGDLLSYLRLRTFPLGLGVDLRYDQDSGQTVDERAFTGSLQIKADVRRRFHPYGTIGYGYGHIGFNYLPDPSDPSYTFDNGPILAGGGGIEIDVTRHFGAKADYQFQNWTLGQRETINPSTFNFGIVYTVPFRPWTHHGHEEN